MTVAEAVMPRIEIAAASFAHAEELAQNLRAGDAMEIAALGFTPLEALDAVLCCSVAAQTALVGNGQGPGQVAAMWGFAAPSLLGDTADLWAFSGHAADAHPLPFLKASREFVTGLQHNFRRLRALVALDYHKAVRWLRWLGFEDGEIETYGGRDFMRVNRYGR
jgi:hypothetical protein